MLCFFVVRGGGNGVGFFFADAFRCGFMLCCGGGFGFGVGAFGFFLGAGFGGGGCFVFMQFVLAEQLLVFDDGFGEQVGDQVYGADGVVVVGDDVLDQVGVAVAVGDGDNWDVQFVGFIYGQLLLVVVDHVECVGQLFYLYYVGEVAFQLVEFVFEDVGFFFGYVLEVVVVVDGVQFLEVVQLALDDVEVGEYAVYLVMGDVVLVVAFVGFLDGVLGLFLGADEEDLLVIGDQVMGEAVGVLEY